MTAADSGSTSERTSGSSTGGATVLRWLTTTDHKTIANMYLVTSFGFFLFAGLLAMVMRAELARPGMQLASSEQYNQLFTIHGTVMMLLFATPTSSGSPTP